MMAPEELFNDNQKLVGFVYRKYVHDYNSPNKDDIMQEGMLALWQAAQRFDESKGIKFSTFAVSYILGNMKSYMRGKCNVIKIPRSSFDNPEELSNLMNIASLDTPISNGVENLYFRDIIEGKPDDYEYITEDLIDSFLNTILNQRDRDIMEEYYYLSIYDEAPAQRYLMDKYHITQSSLSRLIHKYNEQFKKFVYE